jgi:crotonobetainyl-CoA:carnitine CoA-transferase CaiB-like acyl-CoA transferase
MVGSPIKTLPLEDAPAVLPPPELGEHTEEILTSALGLDPEEVQRLAAAGAIALRSA